MSLALPLPQLWLSVPAGGLTTLSPSVFPLLLVLGGAVQGHRLAPAAMGPRMVLSFADIGLVRGALGLAPGIGADAIRPAGEVMLITFALMELVPMLGDGFSREMLPITSAAIRADKRVEARVLAWLPDAWVNLTIGI